MARSLRVLDVINAAVDTLTADATLTALLGSAKVYTHVPEDTAAPYVKIESSSEEPWAEATSDDNGSRCTFAATIYSVKRGTYELDTIANRIVQVATTRSTWSGLSRLGGYLFEEYRVMQNEQMVEGVIYRQAYVRVSVYLG